MAIRQLKITPSTTSRDSLSLQKYFTDLGKLPTLSPEQETAVCTRIRENDPSALTELVQANLRFVVSVAKRYEGHGLSLPDLINEGNIGLIRAAGKFDATRGFKFISFAVWYVRQQIMTAISEQGRLVRLPLNRVGTKLRVLRATQELEQVHGRTPSAEEIAEHLAIDINLVKEAQLQQDSALSLDLSLQEDGDGLTIGDSIESEDAAIAMDAFTQQSSLAIELQRLISRLPNRERMVLLHVFGVGGHALLSPEEIGEKLDITKERVRQIKERALKRLRWKGTGLLREFL